MDNGYYISTYFHIDKLSYLKNIGLRHDMNAALWKKTNNHIELIRYWELERLTGQKHHYCAFFDKKHAEDTLNILLSEFGISLSDIRGVWGTPELDNTLNYHSLAEYPMFNYHSLCHIASSMFLDMEIFNTENILGLAVDGIPDCIVDKNALEKNFYTGVLSQNGKFKNLFPIYSPGPIWIEAKNFFGLGEGTLMAMVNLYNNELSNNKLLNFDDFLIKDYSTFKNFRKKIKCFLEYIQNTKLSDLCKKINFSDNVDEEMEKEIKISMAMKFLQKKSIEIMEKNIDFVIKEYNINPENYYLSISGGYGLNCPTNSYLMKKYNFKGFLGPPCMNDSGMSLGMGLYYFYKKMNGMFSFKFKSAYYGCKDNDISILKKYSTFINDISKVDDDKVVDDVIKFPVAVFQENSEIGPRALGNRSILAYPVSSETKEIVNKIKKRETWRPVAPIILEEELNNWFEDSYSSPYMLHTYMVSKIKKDFIPSALHKDNTARVQSINLHVNRFIYNILTKFKQKHNIPLLCNTSLNDRDEPIINKIEELINFCLRKNIKIAYINEYRVEFKNHKNFFCNTISKRLLDFENYVSKKNILMSKLNPYNISKIAYVQYLLHDNIKKDFDLKNKEHVQLLETLTMKKIDLEKCKFIDLNSSSPEKSKNNLHPNNSEATII